MKVIIGLGNPGKKYRDTRHNVGFLIIESLAESLGIKIKTKKFNGISGKGKCGTQNVTLFMPMTFMNLSGVAVAQLVKGTFSIQLYRKRLKDLLVIYDDVDLRFGNIRIRNKGSAGGHRGLSSIIENLGTEEFPRLRVGIRGRDRIEDTSGYVLSPFTAGEKLSLKGVIDRACDCALTWLEDGLEVAMNRFNRSQMGP